MRRSIASWWRKRWTFNGMLACVLLVAAIATEVVGTLALRASDGLSRLVPTIIVIVGYLASFGLLAVVLKTMPVGIVVAVLGKVFFADPVPPLAMVGMVLIVGGVALVSMSGVPTH